MWWLVLVVHDMGQFVFYNWSDCFAVMGVSWHRYIVVTFSLVFSSVSKPPPGGISVSIWASSIFHRTLIIIIQGQQEWWWRWWCYSLNVIFISIK